MYYNAYVLFPLGNISETASVWFTLILSIERYLAMCSLKLFCPTQSTKINEKPEISKLSCDENNNFSFYRHIMLNLKENFRLKRCWLIIKLNQIHLIKNCFFLFCLKLNINYKQTIIFVTILSVCFNFPLFFVQKIVKKSILHKKTNPKFIKASVLANSSLNNPQYNVYTSLTWFGNSNLYKTFSWIRILFIQGFPLIFLCIANFCLFRLIHLANCRRKKVFFSQTKLDNPNSSKFNKISGSNARWNAAEQKLTVLLIIIVGLFLTGQIPQAFAYVTIFEAFNQQFGAVCKRWQCCPPYLIYRAIAHLLCLFTYAINFFVYFSLNKHFRKQIKQWFLFSCINKRIKLISV